LLKARREKHDSPAGDAPPFPQSIIQLVDQAARQIRRRCAGDYFRSSTLTGVSRRCCLSICPPGESPPNTARKARHADLLLVPLPAMPVQYRPSAVCIAICLVWGWVKLTKSNGDENVGGIPPSLKCTFNHFSVFPESYPGLICSDSYLRSHSVTALRINSCASA